MKREVERGFMLPRGYGWAYRDYMRDCSVAYPLGVNLIVRFFRSLWHKSIQGRPTKLDGMLTEAFRAGVKHGSETEQRWNSKRM